ncbi:hypothetical protein Tco_0264883 [Tanacetum coccineum]
MARGRLFVIAHEACFQVDGNNMVARVVPVVIVIPGLTSDSDSPESHTRVATSLLCDSTLGHIPIWLFLPAVIILDVSDCFYTGGWTQDLREVVNHLHSTQPEAPLLAIGPWHRVGKALRRHDLLGSSIKLLPELLENLRWASSGRLVTSVTVPLLCINAIDDPVSTYEAIPYDECRNVHIKPIIIWSKTGKKITNHSSFGFLINGVNGLIILLANHEVSRGEARNKQLICGKCHSTSSIIYSFDQFLPKKVRDRFAWVKRQSVIDKATYCHDTTSLTPFVSANEDLMKLKQEVASLLEVPEEGNINEVADDAREKLADL